MMPIINFRSFIQASRFYGSNEASSIRLYIRQPGINGYAVIIVRFVNNLYPIPFPARAEFIIEAQAPDR